LSHALPIDPAFHDMILEGRFTIPASQERVWQAIWDVPTLASWVPGCTSAEEIAPDRYRVHLEQQVAFMKAAFDNLLEVVERHEPNRVALSGEGEDRRLGSNVKIQTVVDLVSTGDNETQLRYRHDLSVFGKLGALGFPIIQRKAREAEAEFARRARASLAQTDAPEGDPATEAPA
jgi:carbon monoxide dehydrogenase subunit G